nr:hypothetical protein CFP56_48186 [Quercus suber]
MVAVGGRPRFSLPKVSGQKADSEEAAGNAAEKSPKQGGLGIPMNAAAMAASRGDVGSPREAGNPSSVINSEAVFPGTVAEITHTNKECIYSHANVKEANSVNVGTVVVVVFGFNLGLVVMFSSVVIGYDAMVLSVVVDVYAERRERRE